MDLGPCSNEFGKCVVATFFLCVSTLLGEIDREEIVVSTMMALRAQNESSQGWKIAKRGRGKTLKTFVWLLPPLSEGNNMVEKKIRKSNLAKLTRSSGWIHKRNDPILYQRTATTTKPWMDSANTGNASDSFSLYQINGPR